MKNIVRIASIALIAVMLVCMLASCSNLFVQSSLRCAVWIYWARIGSTEQANSNMKIFFIFFGTIMIWMAKIVYLRVLSMKME